MASTTGPRGLLRVLRLKIQALRQISRPLSLAFETLDALAAQAGGCEPSTAKIEPPRTGSQDAIGHLAMIETALIRAQEHERLGMGLSTAEIELMMARSELDFGSQVRVIYFFTLAGDDAWNALPRPETHVRRGNSRDPVVLTLRALALNPTRHLVRNPDLVRDGAGGNRRVQGRLRNVPLGFCRLLVEETLAQARIEGVAGHRRLSYLDRLLDDPFLAVAAPVRYADLRSCLKLGVARHLALNGSSGKPRELLRQGVALMAHGSRDVELQELHFETRILVELSDGHLADALPFFSHYHLLPAGSQAPERRVDAIMQYALALSADDRRRPRTDLLLESTLHLLDGLSPRLRPRSRLQIGHFSALADLRRARGHGPHPLGCLCDGVSLHPGDIRRRVSNWAAGVDPETLSRAARRLAGAGRYPEEAAPGLRLHRSLLLGQCLLSIEPKLAVAYLLDAKHGFDQAKRPRLAALAGRDLVACLALLHRDAQCRQALDELCAYPYETCSPEHELLEDLKLLAGGLEGITTGNALNPDALLSRTLLAEPAAGSRPRLSAGRLHPDASSARAS